MKTTKRLGYPLFLVLTPQQEVLWVQDALEEITGYSVQEIVGLPMAELGDRAQHPDNFSALVRTLNTPTTFSGRAHFRRKDGQTEDCVLDIRPLFDRRGRLQNYILYGVPDGGLSASEMAAIEAQTVAAAEADCPYMSVEAIHGTWAKLLNLINQEGMYRNASLKLPDIAQELKINRTYLSRVIRHFAGTSINQVLNRYRMAAVRRELVDADAAFVTLEAIGERCGFGSERSFYRVFKAMEGVTPRDFVRKNGVIRPR